MVVIALIAPVSNARIFPSLSRGIAIPMMIRMIAITTRSSMSENPLTVRMMLSTASDAAVFQTCRKFNGKPRSSPARRARWGGRWPVAPTFGPRVRGGVYLQLTRLFTNDGGVDYECRGSHCHRGVNFTRICGRRFGPARAKESLDLGNRQADCCGGGEGGGER